ncbi:MAG: class I SAM-dependent methyltransferase [Marmoricola sp.]
MPAAATSLALVTDEHVVVPAAVVAPVVVTFDGQYVWSFIPRRDGVRGRGGWKVEWPEVMRPLLDGTSRVRVADAAGEHVHFEGDVSFQDNPDALRLRDQHGHPLAVDKAGHLTRVFSETGDDTRRQIAEGTARAIADLRDEVGIDAHVSYGCLLGAVREGRMIGHDSDSDLAYISAHTHPADVVRESFRIEREMRELGWKVVRMSGADLKLFLPLPDGRNVHVDVFAAFHIEGVFYQMGGRSGRLAREALTPASTVVLEGVELAAPADPEAVLEFLYGPDWRIPDPAFKPVDPWIGVRRLDGWMRGVRTHVASWNETFRNHRSRIPRRRSSFAEWSQARIPGPATLVDVGSGSGRDSAWFSRQGHRVVALDFSGAALRQTRGRLHRLGIEDPDVRVLLLNDLRAALLAGAELAREERPPYLYGRGLVGCLDADARDNLWRLCSMSLRRGGALFLEFPATGRSFHGAMPAGLVQRVRTRTIVREIRAAGGVVVHLEVGPGHDFYDQPDPRVARLEVRWDRPTAPSASTDSPSNEEHQMSPKINLATRKEFFRKASAVPDWMGDVRAAVHENRRLNRRVAELTDVVAELLVPIADRDADKARELLETYRRTTLAP